ncbi:iron-hydroxamate ABC transporter substrate-binding protein [Clostridium sp. CF012]|uniref:iron-hydroxamate ABC transporter substrate-binding protein n=1 Tax=Clostridium sp. CF012 TaxID=2843319 RepID=UPI001C0E74CC|nr:iron-hydroxamate ABC transporter substrate-binding protein [Clostridium sp. CF012]MBU3145347.1 iron-hydroxamate ABC transporter substrate-binding protein [Clostridium sp. CF012]
MKKILVPMLLIIVLIISGCSKQNSSKVETTTSSEVVSKTNTYQSENGAIEVPENPQRIVVLYGTLSGHVMALGGNILGVEEWSMGNPRYKQYLTNAVEVSDENIEKIVELKPDLIIAGSTSKNLDKLAKIAPTVSFTYGKLDYLAQYIEVGKLMNKEKQAKEWVDNFKAKAKKAGEDIKAKIGADATVSVIEGDNKQLYVYGNNWGRGTEILYKEMGLKIPKKVEENALKPGYYAISSEVLPQYAGDYMVFCKNSAGDNSFQKTDTYKNIPAVKNNRVLEVEANGFYFNDPISLDYQLDTFIKYFSGIK